MQRSVLVRPNLKGFLLGAGLVLVAHHLTNGGNTLNPAAAPVPVYARETTDPVVADILEKAGSAPRADVYMRISHHYENVGDFKRALVYMRLAGLANEMDGSDD